MSSDRVVGIVGALVAVVLSIAFGQVASAQAYIDVDASFWAHEEISALDQDGFNIRCTESPRRFCPTAGLQNAAMAAWLSKASKGVDYLPPAASGNRFDDMPISHWAVSWAEDIDRNRIYRGCEDQSRFCPTKILTRAQFAQVLVKAYYGADYQPPTAQGLFTDVPVGHWAGAYIEQLKRDGIVWGCRNRSDQFCPSDLVSRAVAASWLVRRFEIGDDTDPEYVEVYPRVTQTNIANPHRGFMYWGSASYQSNPDDESTFTYVPDDLFNTGSSIYHVYVSWRDVEPQDQQFDWSKLERQRLLPIIRNDPRATFVLRIMADYPGGDRQGSSALYSGGDRNRDFPAFLTALGIRTETYGPAYNRPVCAETSGSGITPDWNDARMIRQMEQLIAAFGARFDGDPRITAIQSGTLGLWGEGHQWSCPHDIDIGDQAKAAVRDAYDRAFVQTPVQTRYPGIAEANGVEFGFYEDYFPSFTVQCSRYPEFGDVWCSDGGDWNLYYGYTYLTPGSVDNWKSNPISGESPAGDQQSFWINKTPAIRRALGEYHFSFLGPAGAHNGYYNSDNSVNGINPQIIADMPASERSNPVPWMTARLRELKNDLGYRLNIEKARWTAVIGPGEFFDLELSMLNSGVAPVYQQDYAVEITLVDSSGRSAWRALWTYPLTEVISDTDAVTRQRSFQPTGLSAGDYSLRVRAVNRLQGRLDSLLGNAKGPPLQFESEPRDGDGRVILGSIRLTN